MRFRAEAKRRILTATPRSKELDERGLARLQYHIVEVARDEVDDSGSGTRAKDSQ